MKKITIILLLFFVAFTSCKKEEIKKTNLTLGDFTLSTDQLSPGEPVTIQYNGNSSDVEAIYYYMVKNKNYPVDINFKDQKATFKLPDSAQAVIFTFTVDGNTDNNNKKGYIYPLVNNNGKEITGSKAALSSYLITRGKYAGLEVNIDSLYQIVKQDLNNHPELKKDWDDTFLYMTYSIDKKEGKKLIEEKIAKLEKKGNLTENDYGRLIDLYAILKNKKASDSLQKIVLEKFPNGSNSKNNDANQFYKSKNLEEKATIFSDFKKKFNKLGNSGNYMAQTLALDYFKKGNKEKFNEYAAYVDNKQNKASLYNSIAWSLAEKGKDLEFAAKLSKSSLDILESEEKNLVDKPDYLSVNQYKKNLINSYNMYADTYALILFKQGKIKEAISFQEKAVGDGLSNDVNERYIEYLIADKQYKEAEKKAEEFIKKGNATQKINEFYKTAFLKNTPNEEKFKAQMAKLEKDAHEKQLAHIKKSMINEKAYNFTLKELNGNSVSLASLKGKTIILDFWATWCGPCKASFPGMQKVVTKYKDDHSVVFLFIDTFERGKNRVKNVADFIKKNKYTFHVLLDKQLDDSNDFEVAPEFGITGIPTKIIIGPDGNVKFKAVGYSGNIDKLVSEMDMMIELLKK